MRLEYKHFFNRSPQPEGRKLFGHIDGILVDDDGNIYMSIWKHQKEKPIGEKTFYCHQQSWEQIKIGVPAAIRRCNHIVSNYIGQEGERENMINLINSCTELWQFFLEHKGETYQAEVTKIAMKVRRLALEIGRVIEPHKKESQIKLIQIATSGGKDRLGRFNPGAMAAKMLATLTRLEERVENGIGAIVAEYSLRRAGLEQVRDSQLEVISLLIDNIEKMLDNCELKSLRMITGHIDGVKSHIIGRLTTEPYLSLGSQTLTVLNQVEKQSIELESLNNEEAIDLAWLEIEIELSKLIDYLETPGFNFDKFAQEIGSLRGEPVSRLKHQIPQVLGSSYDITNDEIPPFNWIMDDARSALIKAAEMAENNEQEKTDDYLEVAISRIHF